MDLKKQQLNPKVYIIILNYNNWQDTIECLESILNIDYNNYQVIVVDNSPNDNSLEKLLTWTEGKLDHYSPGKSKDDFLLFNKKPLPKEIYFHQAGLNDFKSKNNNFENNRNENLKESQLQLQRNSEEFHMSPLILIKTNKNFGFASGNNVGLTFAMSREDSRYFWLINNDTIVDKKSLSFLVEKSKYYEKNKMKISIIGSKICDYGNRDIIQSVGGIHNKWLGIGKHLGEHEKDVGQYDGEEVLKKVNYVMGAAMFVNSDFIKDTGKMREDFFLYFEDFAWCLEGKIKGWELGYCWNSKIYHKSGSTIGSHSKGRKRSTISDYYLLINRIKFTRDYFPKQLTTVLMGFIIVLFNRIIRFQIIQLLRFHYKNKTKSH